MNDEAIEFLDVPVLFGRFLILSGILTESDVAQATRVQKDLNAHPLLRLIERGDLTIDQLKRARVYQQERMVTLCQALDALGIMGHEECSATLDSVGRENIPLGEVLVRQGRITPEALADALEKHLKHRNRHFGEAFE